MQDPERYQTVYSRSPGSAAAPTAGLHFTPALIERLQAQGVGFARLTLHVGLDTFAPVTEADPSHHHMHTEWCQLTPETAAQINATRRAGRAHHCRRYDQRAHPGERCPPGSPGRCGCALEGPSDLYILPGYTFRAVDAMLTNFHLPRSTLIMLVSAFAGRERLLAAYELAVQQGYRFYSFGDAMLIL